VRYIARDRGCRARPPGGRGKKLSILLFIQLGGIYDRSVGAVRIGRTIAQAFHSEFSLYFRYPDEEPALDFCDCLSFSEVAGLIEVLQVGSQLVKKFVWEAMAHRESILPQNRCTRSGFFAGYSS
jgi:hypothetical protein